MIPGSSWQGIWRFPEIGVPRNHPFFLMVFSTINHPFWGSPIYGNLHMFPSLTTIFPWLVNIFPLIPLQLSHFKGLVHHFPAGPGAPMMSTKTSKLPMRLTLVAARSSREVLERKREWDPDMSFRPFKAGPGEMAMISGIKRTSSEAGCQMIWL